ncbi:MAG TPA: hypothetical protein VGG30_13040 [Pirellulales bacterium]
MFCCRLLFVLAILMLAAAARGDEPAASLPSPLEPGRFAMTIASGGLDRAVHIRIPEGYQPDGIPIMTRSPTNFRTNLPLCDYGQLKSRTPRVAIDDVAFIRQLLDELKNLGNRIEQEAE